MSGFKKKLKFCVNNFWLWGAQYPTGENLNVAWAEFSTFEIAMRMPFIFFIAEINYLPNLKLKTLPKKYLGSLL
jgi:hypothetical protein